MCPNRQKYMTCSPALLAPTSTLTNDDLCRLLQTGMAVPTDQRVAAALIECLLGEVEELTRVADDMAWQLGRRFTVSAATT